jgi:hypothetical protein
MTQKYVLLVRSVTGIQRYPIPPIADGKLPELHLGQGDVRSIVNLHAEGGAVIGQLFFHGDVDSEWLVARVNENGEPPDLAALVNHYQEDERTDPSIRPPSLSHELDDLGTVAGLLAANLDPTTVTENDARRLHAFADYLTACDLLHELIVRDLSSEDMWIKPGAIDAAIARARNCLQTIYSTARYLSVETRSDFLDLHVSCVKDMAFPRKPVGQA